MNVEETYLFKASIKVRLLILFVVGLVLAFIGLMFSPHADHGQEEKQEVVALVSATDINTAVSQDLHVESEHHGHPIWLKRIYTSLWHNNIFFVGIGIIGLFFLSVQYAAQAGWSASIERIPLAMGHWIPISGLILLLLWVVAKEDLFHWTHSYLYDQSSPHFDAVIYGKGAYFYWPLQKGTFPFFFLLRLFLFFGLWYLFFIWIKQRMLREDNTLGVKHWLSARKLSAIFLVIFGVSSSIAAWDWVMSIDPHWYSTMMGWYVFSSWWVSGLAAIGLFVIALKKAGYLKIVNENHLHDLGKYVFAFSIFWTYIWFSQFLLIYYANIPEESVYFFLRMKNSPYSWIFYVNVIFNFVLPFLLLMTRDAKRQASIFILVCPIVIIGHWLDFYNMITPGIMKEYGVMGLLEIGVFLMFIALFLWISLSALSRYPLIAKHHPMLEESKHHHI